MSKDAKNTEATVENNEVATVETVVSNNNVAEALQGDSLAEVLAAKTKRSYTNTSKYLKMEDGEIGRFAAVEVKTMFVDDNDSDIKDAKKEIPCVVLVNEKNETVTAAQMKLVNALTGSVPCFVEVESLGKKDLGKGRSYSDYVVTILD